MMRPTRSAVDAIGSRDCGSATIARLAVLGACADARPGDNNAKAAAPDAASPNPRHEGALLISMRAFMQTSQSVPGSHVRSLLLRAADDRVLSPVLHTQLHNGIFRAFS